MRIAIGSNLVCREWIRSIPYTTLTTSSAPKVKVSVSLLQSIAFTKLWEGRSGRFHNTHSKALCWVALDRLIKMYESGHLEVSVDLFRTNRNEIRKKIEAHGYNERIRSYTRTFDGEELDASLLTLPLYGYIEGTHPRMRSTCARVHEKLARGELVYRYETGTGDGLLPARNLATISRRT